MNKRRNNFKLDSMYDTLPKEVRELYSNMVNVSCSGDLMLDIKINDGKIGIEKLDMNTLLNYTFSYMDKNGLLKNGIKKREFDKVIKRIFNDRLKLYIVGNEFEYGNYIYKFDSSKITRKSNECKNDSKTVTYLYGYSIGDKGLFMDVLVGTLKDNDLYDYKDNKIDKYNENKNKLPELLNKASYYRYYYQKYGDEYKLDSVEWISK